MAQTFHDFELIVVDDGSTDDTSETVRRFGGPVRFLQQANLGPGAARNFGADHAAGRYLAFLDSDDLWFPWTLDAYARVIAQHHSPAFIAGKPRVFNSTSELKSVHQEPLSVAVFGDYFRSGDQWRWWGATSFVIRADAFGAAGGFTNEPINGEDADLALRLGDTPGFVQITAPITFGYRQHDSMATHLSRRTFDGVRHAVAAERDRRYPGGDARSHERWRILMRHARPVILDGIKSDYWRDAWRLYVTTFPWNARVGHWRFLAGVPLMLVAARLGWPMKSGHA
jgi:glycosyltransferase involved in cell wall biosynthesis